ncbi:MAG: DUF308 domain-containing protein [Vicingaceae bacterium]
MDVKTLRTFLLIKGLLLALLGLIFVVWPGKVASIIAFYVGILMLFGGIVSFFYTYRLSKISGFKFWSYLVPFTAIAGGFIFLIWPEQTLSLFALVIGAWVLLEGLQQLRLSGENRYGRRPGGWMIIMGLLSLMIGIFILTRPFELVKLLTVFYGILMLISGIFMIYSGIGSRE